MLVLVPFALAAPAACPAPYTSSQVAADLRDVQSGLRGMDDALFDSAGQRLERGLPCLDQVLPTPVFAAIYRYVGAWHWIIPGNTTAAKRWFRSSLELDPHYAWDVEELDPQSAIRRAWEAEQAAAMVPIQVIEGKVLAGSWVLDGRAIAVPGATPDRPHVLQRSQDGTTTWLVEGAGFPGEALQDAPVAAATTEPPKRGRKPEAAAPSSPTATGFDVVRVDRERPPAKTPLLLVGGVGVLAAGGVYSLALLSRGEFEAATTTEEVESLQARTNLLVLASGGTLVLGLGLGGWGALLDGGAAFGVTRAF